MKNLYFYLLFTISALVMASCQDEDFGFTSEDIFKGQYERNFIEAFGPIDPNQSWDLSSYAREKRNLEQPETRTLGQGAKVDDNGWYNVEKGTLNYIETKLSGTVSHQSEGNSFGLLMGNEEFEVIPIYQDGISDVTWELHMVLLTSSSAKDVTLWENTWDGTNAGNFQKIKDNSAICETCNGRGMVKGEGSILCTNCNAKGYLPRKGDVSDVKCPLENCNNGKVEVPCTVCDENGQAECNNCDGRGFYEDTPIAATRYYGCQQCSTQGTGWSYFKNWGRGYKKGNGLMTCKNCGGDRIAEVDCSFCEGDGWLQMCPICDSKGTAILCGTCGGDGLVASTDAWTKINSSDRLTTDAKAIRSKPITVNSSTFGGTPTEGNLVYFYVYITSSKKNYNSVARYTSLDNKMLVLNCPRPTNVVEGCDVIMIGCEESSIDTDFNDLVFLLVGKTSLPKVVNTEETNPVKIEIKKRYMVEDMGSAVDWDFNDIIVDVSRITKKTPYKNGGIYKKYQESTSENAYVRWLCGTLPIKVFIGDTEIPQITNPMNQEQTLKQLAKESDAGKSKFDPNKDKVVGWSPNSEHEIETTTNKIGWDPDLNNIKVVVIRLDNTTGERNNWIAEFGKTGNVPYIIAVDQNVSPMDEGVNIPETWWKNGSDTSHN